jgi:hypothetical protein
MWRDTGLQEAGYTRDYLDPSLLNLPNATMTGKRLAVEGPGYKAMIIDSEQEPVTDPVKTSMPVEVARKILGYARAGLPVIIVGTPPDRTPGFSVSSDAELQETIRQLLAEPNVYRVAHESDVPGKLRSLGILPAAEPGSSSAMLSVHRRDRATKTDYYFLYNQGVVSPKGEPANLFEPATGTPLDIQVSLEGSGSPYLLDAWSGKITPIVHYTSADSRVTLRVRLSRDNAQLIALSDDPLRFGVTAPKVRVTATSAIGTVPAAIDLTNAKWELSAEDWQPANPYATTLGAAAVETQKTPVTVELDGLKAWPEIPRLQHASGIGTYVTTFDLPAGWTARDGATLSLGEVFDSFTLRVNGKLVPIDQLSAEAEVGRYLTAGRNTIAVRVATTLNNRLAQIDDSVAKRGLVQHYGLVGPVVLTTYAQVSLAGQVAGAAHAKAQ